MRVILTSKNEKLFESSVSFYILIFRVHVIDKMLKMFFRFKQNKNIINVTSVNYRFELGRTFIKPNFFIITKKGVRHKGEPIVTPSICLKSLLSKMKDYSVVASFSKR